jgi:transmembrane sensor
MTQKIIQFDEQACIEATAREWLIRLDRDQPPSKQEIAQLRQWAAQSKAHHDELVRISAFWNDANILTELSTPVYNKTRWSLTRIVARLLKPLLPPTPLIGRVASYAALSLFAVSFAFMLLKAPSPISSNGLYVSAIGELKQQTLADGSVVQLNTDSQIQVDFSTGTRKIRLLRGEAHFDVSHNADWPFQVYAGNGMVKAVGTAFSVRLDRDSVKVTVDEGRVDLAAAAVADTTSHAPSSMQKIASLQVGQSAQISNIISTNPGTSAPQPLQVISDLAQQELERQLAWRTGYLVFTGNPLSEVIAEINRYTPLQIEIGDPALANLSVGGRFKVGELDAMFDVLETGFGIQVSRLDDHRVQLTRAAKAAL